MMGASNLRYVGISNLTSMALRSSSLSFPLRATSNSLKIFLSINS